MVLTLPSPFEALDAAFAPYPTPFMVLDLGRVRANAERIEAAFRPLRPRLYYSIKANGDLRLLASLHEMGWGFDVASLGEMRWLQDLGVGSWMVNFSATVKVPQHIEEAHALGVRLFGFDSAEELRKLALLAPGCRGVLRLEVSQTGSRWPLGGKFGVPVGEAVPLLERAAELGVEPYGLAFHVGSQCVRTESWPAALVEARRVWDEAAARGIELKLLNLGGGFPAPYTDDVPSVAQIGNEVCRHARRLFPPDVGYALEPGRFMVAEAGVVATTVIGKALRKGRPWVFVDLSVYSGLFEVLAGWSYPIVTARDDRPKRTATLAGPSCDSTDILAREVELPDLEVGDRLLLLSAGAYTTAYRQYNGFSFPEVLVVDSAGVATGGPEARVGRATDGATPEDGGRQGAARGKGRGPRLMP
ncbi:MAG TPA: type III PLP-dependent enzyme [Dehalococcoidia bacterium]|nr:type III PLP-dependent enzyme [Dehalococcoidia bacterium]